MFNLKGKVALVTGSASGIGKELAIGFSDAGAEIICIDLVEDKLNNLVDSIKSNGKNAFGIKCNVAEQDEVFQAVKVSFDLFDKVDILVNNAGFGQRSKAEEMSIEAWDNVIDTNLKGAFLFCREIGNRMIKNSIEGRIINIASIAGLVGLETGNANYSASKGGLIAMTRALAIEWAKHNILVNAIAPSHTRTKLIKELIHEKPEVENYFRGNIPLGRLADPQEIVGPAIFLASKAASFITGHVLVVDGGHTAK